MADHYQRGQSVRIDGGREFPVISRRLEGKIGIWMGILLTSASQCPCQANLTGAAQ